MAVARWPLSNNWHVDTTLDMAVARMVVAS